MDVSGKVINEKYQKNISWQKDCPLVVLGLFLLIDKDQFGQVVSRKIAFPVKNISNNEILAYKGRVISNDSFGNPKGETPFECSEIEDFLCGQVFGEDIFFTIPNDGARNQVIIEKILFKDDSLKDYSKPVFINSSDLKFNYENSEREYYEFAWEKLNIKKNLKNRFHLTDGYFCCACGEINLEENKKCNLCGVLKEKLVQAFNLENIKKDIRNFSKQFVENFYASSETNLSSIKFDQEEFDRITNHIKSFQKKFVLQREVVKNQINKIFDESFEVKGNRILEKVFAIKEKRDELNKLRYSRKNKVYFKKILRFFKVKKKQIIILLSSIFSGLLLTYIVLLNSNGIINNYVVDQINNEISNIEYSVNLEDSLLELKREINFLGKRIYITWKKDGVNVNYVDMTDVINYGLNLSADYEINNKKYQLIYNFEPYITEIILIESFLSLKCEEPCYDVMSIKYNVSLKQIEVKILIHNPRRLFIDRVDLDSPTLSYNNETIFSIPRNIVYAYNVKQEYYIITVNATIDEIYNLIDISLLEFDYNEFKYNFNE